jgi:hypothetical protein
MKPKEQIKALAELDGENAEAFLTTQSHTSPPTTPSFR